MTASNADIAAWTAFLDELESGVIVANRSLDDGNAIRGSLIEPWNPPQHLSRLPEELLERAQQVSRAIAALEQRASSHRDELKIEIDRTSVSKTRAAKASGYGVNDTPKYVDRSV